MRISDWSSDVCSSDLRQEARKLALFVGFARLADADRLIIGLGVDIDETTVDLAPRRALFERRDRRTKGRVREHRAIDQHAVGRVAVGVARQLRANEGVASSEEHTSELQSLMRN